ncbi:MAG: recombinase family protein [Candidatus Melainabacteria bacterium]|nr:recombinase family protein [Candidatus Melainabacteria bacterium]
MLKTQIVNRMMCSAEYSSKVYLVSSAKSRQDIVGWLERFRNRDQSSDERLRQPLHPHTASSVSKLNCSCDDLVDGLSSDLGSRWGTNTVSNARKTRLVAYVRNCGDLCSCETQRAVIEDYCQHHGYIVTKVFEDNYADSLGLSDAMKALSAAEGLITFDLARFCHKDGEQQLELRPIFHHFIGSEKHLIAVKEGLDTKTSAGQAIMLNLMNDGKNNF